MTATAVREPARGARTAVRRAGGRVGGGMLGFWSSISAVGAKELRGRMRGRRAFIVLTVYLLLLSGFAFGIYEYLRQQSLQASQVPLFSGGVDTGGWSSTAGTSAMALSATVGSSIFGGLLLVETLLVLVLAPAFTSGAISLEREKQTIDMLVTTPLSTFGMVLGKLLSALTWVFLLILASVPLASVVFAFGGVGPEDLLRGYALLFALAFGMGAIGMFISALVRRTQTATVVTFVAVLCLTLGAMAVHEFWRVVTTPVTTSTNGFISVAAPARPPEAILWLNPFVGVMDLICTTAPGGYEARTCGYIATVTGTPYFGAPVDNVCSVKGCPVTFGGGVNMVVAVDAVNPPVAIDGGGGGGKGGGVLDDTIPGPIAQPPVTTPATLGFPRDTFWPHNVLGFVSVGIVLTLLSSQLVAPTRRLRLIPARPGFLRRRRPAAATTASNVSEEETIPSPDASGSETPSDLIAASEVEDQS
jgi:ABC-type transport system involved in multi-copper enzyme maturation permease subunit